MKKIALLLVLALFGQISKAQKLGALLSDNELKGRVKKVTKFLFLNGKNETDTLQQPDIIIQEFDQNGNMTKELRKGNKFPNYRIYCHYHKDRTITAKKYDSYGAEVGGFTYKYDDSGNLIEIKREGMIFGPPREIFKNDDTGRHMEIDHFVDDTVVGSKTYIEYGENGLNNIRSTYRIDKQFMGHDSFTYDSLKNLIEYKLYFPDGNLEQKQIFTYNNWDQNNNWQLKIIATANHTRDFQFELLYVIIKRKIEYY